MNLEDKWAMTLRAMPEAIRAIAEDARKSIKNLDEYMERDERYVPLEDQYINDSWRAFGRPKFDQPPKPYDRPPDAPRPGDPDPRPNEMSDYVPAEP